MSQPYLGEIRMFAGNFPPLGWYFCEGQLIPISENDALYTLIGTTYGGDGQETFALPDLRGRIPIHMGSGHTLAENGGIESVTLTTQQIPAHSHAVIARGEQGNTSNPEGAALALSSLAPFSQTSDPVNASDSMHVAAVSPVGGSQPHDNMMPYTCVSFIISAFGVFPSQS
ncbi:phage tail protein [Paenibacillus sp. NEAU-GSW1]|uniref:phage tail protein n=1 Tax=Paenibacillus sp. NEAU-GSW1 TaxID=2682486 RepID=UPI0012E14376|nr:tail fiber protein [Paenibacillus sp. NEAU-GSW1]MUT67223.1 phage tail protein [Paenibacillus sp. NEAU-GSW1]